ncbi:hypothetical protein pipiens_000146, partial [Culex pipiens pipiens]
MKVTKTGVQLLCSSEESFSSAVAALRGDNVQFHTYTPAAEQPVKLAEKKAELRNAQPPTLRPSRNTVPQNGNPSINSTADTSVMTFAEALSQGNSNNTSNDLFTMSEFLALAREVFARLKSCKSRQDQLEALVELTAKYIYNV